MDLAEASFFEFCSHINCSGPCGIDVSGEVDLEPVMLLDKRVFVDTYTETRPDDKGQEKKYNKIPFNGYHPVTGNEDETPF